MFGNLMFLLFGIFLINKHGYNFKNNNNNVQSLGCFRKIVD